MKLFRKLVLNGSKPGMRTYTLESTCTSFKRKFDENQAALSILSGQDDLLSGMLSKQKGQVLRLAAIFHCLFTLDDNTDIEYDLKEEDIDAAINFTEVCADHTSLMAGKGTVKRSCGQD